jgi:ribosomal protein S18 acetylase RimI-like enzyme
MVRPAGLEDAEAIARVQVETWRAAYAHAIPPESLARADPNERAQRWRGWIGGESATFVGEVDGEVRGFVAVGAAREDESGGELYTIYVLPNAWGSGLATALIECGEAELRRRGFATAMLDVLADNPRARRFYERQGWTATKTFRSTFLGHEVELARYTKTL